MNTTVKTWAEGEGVISHEAATRQRIEELVGDLQARAICESHAAPGTVSSCRHPVQYGSVANRAYGLC